MSKTDTDLPERLRDADATDFERRLLSAARREEPSRALSERMAGAIGVALPVSGGALSGAAKGGSSAKAAAGTSSLGPWVAGALFAAAVTGAFVVTRSAKTLPTPAPPASAVSTPRETPSVVAPRVVVAPPVAAVEAAPKAVPSASPRERRSSQPSDVAEQIALIDAARVSLASGAAEQALAGVRKYEARYPKGTFRPEAAAIRIEALVKQGRAAEARSLAERFLIAHGPSPLADRVARLTGLARP